MVNDDSVFVAVIRRIRTPGLYDQGMVVGNIITRRKSDVLEQDVEQDTAEGTEEGTT